MKWFAVLFVLKLVTLAGSIATTLWALSFIAFTDTLGPYRWELFGYGFAAIIIGEGGSYLLGKYLMKNPSA